MVTIWKTIPGIEDYEISNCGEIRRRTPAEGTRPGKIVKQYMTPRGYLQVRLSHNGHVYNYLVHRLVALTFIKNPNNLPVVNHINSNKTDNHIYNLEWCSQQRNVIHYLNSEKFKMRPEPKRRSILCVESGIEYNGLQDVAEHFNLTIQYVSTKLIKEGKSFNGLHFIRPNDNSNNNQRKPSKRGPILCVETGEKYKKLKDVAEHFNVSIPHISSVIIHGKSFNGLHFIRLEDIDKP